MWLFATCPYVILLSIVNVDIGAIHALTTTASPPGDECAMWKSVTNNLTHNPGILMHCTDHSSCNGFDCAATYSNNGYITSMQDFSLSFCFGLVLNQCDSPLNMVTFMEVPDKKINFTKKFYEFYEDVTYQIPGTTYDLGVGTADAFVDVTLEKSDDGKFITIGLLLKVRVKVPTLPAQWPDELQRAVLPTTTIPAHPCKSKAPMPTPRHQCVPPMKKDSGLRSSSPTTSSGRPPVKPPTERPYKPVPTKRPLQHTQQPPAIDGKGSFLQKCEKTITINNAYNEIHLHSNGGEYYKDGEKIKCDVWFVSGVPNTTISVKFPSYGIAIDGDTQSDWPSSALSAGIPGAPHARGDDGILVYDMVAKKYMLGDSETRWAGAKGLRWHFSGGDVQQKEYQYYNMYLGKMKDVETVKKFTKPAKVYVSYKGEPRKDTFTMEIGLVGLPTTTPTPPLPTTTTTPISSTLTPNKITTAIAFSRLHICGKLVCENGATCKKFLGESTCDCLPGYSGNRCQYDSLSCRVLGCENGGICNTNFWGESSCVCLPGYVGNRCQIFDFPDPFIAPTTPFIPDLPDPDWPDTYNGYHRIHDDDPNVQFDNESSTGKHNVLATIVGVVFFVIFLLLIVLRVYIRRKRIMAVQRNAQQVRGWLVTEFFRALIVRQTTTLEDNDILVANAEGGVEGPTPVNVNRTPTGTMPAPPAYETVIEEGNKFLPPSYDAAMSPVTPQGASAGPVAQSDAGPQATTEPSINVTTEGSVDVTGATQPLVHGQQSNANSDLQQGPFV